MRKSLSANPFVFTIVLLMLPFTILNSASAATFFYYDANGRLAQKSELTGETERYFYDNNGNLVSKNSGEPYFELPLVPNKERATGTTSYGTEFNTRI